jgi:hypothetical protein
VPNSQGFWSYVHDDDQAEGGRIGRLAKDVSAQFEMLTGEPLVLFFDKNVLEWGDKWREIIDSNLASIAFFIPVLTPRYFLSAECRRELQVFARKATNLGIKELILPLLYVTVPPLTSDAGNDDLVTLVRTFQWEDWREVRFAELSSEAYRRAVSRLAERLVDANRQAERSEVAPTVPQQQVVHEGTHDDSPGFLDQMATAEETLPRLGETITAIGKAMEFIGNLAVEATADMKRGEKQAPGFAARLLATRKLAQRMGEPVDQIWSLTDRYASQLHDVDDGFRVLIERGRIEVQQDPNARGPICTFFDAVRSMSVNGQSSRENLRSFIGAVEPIEKMSRDLRPVVRRLREALTRMIEAGEVIGEWVGLIDATGVNCEETAESANSRTNSFTLSQLRT